jgi:triosephosphate isomerase
MRKFLIAGNWKMNGGAEFASDLLSTIKKLKPTISEDVDVLVCPPYISLSMAIDQLHETDLLVGAQNMHQAYEGAFTGEISAKMLVEAGCSYVILGHSERRAYFHETDQLIHAKTKAALANDLAPVVCVGELLEERKSGDHFKVVKAQVQAALDGLSAEEAVQIVIAYEPVWAIGTGETASPEQAQEMHAFIRGILKEQVGELSEAIRILYGGSMKPGNAGELLQQPDVDGGLIGGASLDAESFVSIITTAESLS